MTQAVKEKKDTITKVFKKITLQVQDILRPYLLFENCELCVQILKYTKYTKYIKY